MLVIMQKRLKSYLLIIFISMSLFLFIDFTLGKELQKYASIGNSERISEAYRKSHKVYHHDLVANFDNTIMWGQQIYRSCTNQFGFRKLCNKKKNDNLDYDIVFIGDSFTEAVGLHYKDSFINLISNSLEESNIANMGVSSYSPSIYYSKINYYIKKGLKFDEVVVYIDISDITDEIQRSVVNDRVIDENYNKFRKIKNYARWYFPNTYLILNKIKSLNEDIVIQSVLDYNYYKSAWTYSKTNTKYDNNHIDKGVNESIKNMTKLYNLLKNNNIKMSVSIYPWPGQILHEKSISKQEIIWEKFCEDKCYRFINSFTTFRKIIESNNRLKTVEKYYIKDDVHFNINGHKILAKDFIDNLN